MIDNDNGSHGEGLANQQQETHSASTGRTGPRTPTGKSRSKHNAVKHGLFSQVIVTGNESQEDFDDLLRGLRRDRKPKGLLEDTFVQKIAGILWRYRRFLQKERESGIQDVAVFEITKEYGTAIPVGDVMPVTSHFDQLLRRETNLDRALDRALAQLQRLQDMRQRRSGVTRRSVRRSTDE